MNQLLLFPDPRPLVESLGVTFFRRVPEAAGVYLMRDSQEGVLYVGKAKNLRKRICSYRVANPDRLRKRHLRLLRAVVRIDLEVCRDEQAALAREAELLLALRPRFNRAGTWPLSRQFVAWSVNESSLVFKLCQQVLPGWQFHGPLRAGASSLRAAMVRLAWCVIHQKESSCMPEGWWNGAQGAEVIVPGVQDQGAVLEEMSLQLASACTGKAKEFAAWLREHTVGINHPFSIAVIELDLQRLDSLNKGFRGQPE